MLLELLDNRVLKLTGQVLVMLETNNNNNKVYLLPMPAKWKMKIFIVKKLT